MENHTKDIVQTIFDAAAKSPQSPPTVNIINSFNGSGHHEKPFDRLLSVFESRTVKIGLIVISILTLLSYITYKFGFPPFSSAASIEQTAASKSNKTNNKSRFTGGSRVRNKYGVVTAKKPPNLVVETIPSEDSTAIADHDSPFSPEQ